MFVWLRNNSSRKSYKIICNTEAVGETISNSTEEAFSLNTLVGDTYQKVAQVTSEGRNTLVAQTIDVWTGTNKREISFELRFVASSDPYRDVFLPIRTLQRWASPSVHERGKDIKVGKYNLGVFNYRAPSKLWLKIGEKETIPLVEIKEGIITTCVPSWGAPFSGGGYPMTGELQLTLQDIRPLDSRAYPEGRNEDSASGEVNLASFSITKKPGTGRDGFNEVSGVDRYKDNLIKRAKEESSRLTRRGTRVVYSRI